MKSLFALVALLMAFPCSAEGRSARWTGVMESQFTGETGTMALRVSTKCEGVLQFRCLGRWTCQGLACPAPKGRVAMYFSSMIGGLGEQYLMLFTSRLACPVRFVGTGGSCDPLPPLPLHWQYACFPTSGDGSGDAVDRGTFDLDLVRTQSSE